MCLLMIDQLPFKFSANGPEKDPAAQEMMNGAQMSWDSMMLLLGSPTPKAAVSVHRRYISQVRKCWLCTHDDKSSNSQHPCYIQLSIFPALEDGDRCIPGACWPANQ